MSEIHLSERTRNILAMAREEAVSRRHEFICTEHILLGFLREKEGIATTVLRNLGIDRDALRKEVEQAAARGPGRSFEGEIPITSRARAVLELAMSEAGTLGNTSLGPEHLLIGLIMEGEGIAAEVLTAAGLTAGAVRAEIAKIWS